MIYNLKKMYVLINVSFVMSLINFMLPCQSRVISIFMLPSFMRYSNKDGRKSEIPKRTKKIDYEQVTSLK